MMHRFAGLSLASLLCLAASAHAQAPKPAPAQPGPSTATFPGNEPAPPPAAAPAAAPPAPAPAAPPAPAPAAPTPAPGAPAPAPPAAAPAAPAAAPPAAAPPAPAPVIAEPPPPPPRSNDHRPLRVRRPFFIGGELGWNGLAGFGVNFSYHPIPYLALDSGLGIALTGIRLGGRARVNFLTGDWTPFVALGGTFSPPSEEAIEVQVQGETVKLDVLRSGYVHVGAGVNYTGSEGFVFMATTGAALRIASNTRYVSGDYELYKSDVRPLYRGGMIISLAFGYAF